MDVDVVNEARIAPQETRVLTTTHGLSHVSLG
jgi:hypothetical protein